MTEDDIKRQNAVATERYYELCLSGGLSSVDARLVSDIAVHAVCEAQKTMARIVETAPSKEMQAYAMAIALIAMGDTCKGLSKYQLEMALKAVMH